MMNFPRSHPYFQKYTDICSQFSDVLRYMAFAALGTSVPGVLLAWWLPDHTLPYAITNCPRH